MIKTLLIPVAAFAVTVTGASAFNSDVLRRAGLTDEQVSAFEQAKDLRQSGDIEAARDVLVAAGIDESVMVRLRAVMGGEHKFKHGHDSQIGAAIEAQDYEAFQKAIQGSPLADIINTEEEFKQFVEAHNHLKTGDRQAAKEIMEDLGFVRSNKNKDDDHRGPWGLKTQPFMSSLTEQQQAELRAAFEAKDFEKVHEILKAAEVKNTDKKGKGFGFGLGVKAKINSDID